jgi:hypothetical protein
MTETMKIKYMFREPRFPLLLGIDGYLIGARSGELLQKKLSVLDLKNGAVYDAIDSTGEGWGLYTEHMVLTPLVFKKRWTKREIIKLFNERKNKNETSELYSEKSISSKRLERIVENLVALL